MYVVRACTLFLCMYIAVIEKGKNNNRYIGGGRGINVNFMYVLCVCGSGYLCIIAEWNSSG